MNQRTLLLSLIALSLSASGGLGWYLFNVPAGSGTAILLQRSAARIPQGSPAQKPKEESGALITERTVSFMTAGPTSTSILFVDTPSGRVYRVDAETKEEVPLSLRIPDLVAVRWSPLKTSLIARVRTPQGEQLRLVRLGEQKTTPISGALAATFSPDGLSIATLEPGGIFTQKLDGAERVEWTKTRTGSGDLFWPQQESLALITTNQATRSRDVLLVHKDGTLRRIIAHHTNLETLWSPNGTSVAHTAESGNVQVGLFITTPSETLETKIPATPDSCAWRKDASEILCVSKEGHSATLASYTPKTKKVAEISSQNVRTMGVQTLVINTLETHVFLIPASGVGIYKVPLSDLR
ncbi:MAG: hypothetical protein AAB608_02875 [Patescibacteria group bacterium]